MILDACKIQMWRDISENRYRSWIEKESVNNLQPFQIKNDVFEIYSKAAGNDGIYAKVTSRRKNGYVQISKHYHDGTLRGCIPSLRGYDTISTSMIPFGIRIEYFGKKGNVISPVTTAQWQKHKHLDKKEFVNAIVSSIEFDNLIKHVSDNTINEKSYTQEQIRADYIDFIGELYDVGSDAEI